MRKLSVLLLAATLVLAFTLPAAAVDHIFGGYWRVRAFTQQKFTGEDNTDAKNFQATDSRTRLYYTAKFSDDFKFVNKFEWDWTYGSYSGQNLGRIAADSKDIEIKNSYVDFNVWQKKLNFQVGIHAARLGRSYLFDDDFSGATVTYNGGSWKLPFIWVKGYEGGMGQDANDKDVDYYVLNPSFTLSGLKVNPYFMYVFSDNGSAWTETEGTAGFNDVNLYYAGIDLDYKWEGWNFWGTAIYNGGDAESVALTGQDVDFKGYLLGIGASGAIGPIGLHGQFTYASGDDDAADNDQDAFIPPRGNSYYWSEIMGYGMFDQQVSANSPANHISNIWFVNGGVDYKVVENLKLTFDVWYADRVEALTAGADTPLGTELNFIATYTIMPKLNLDLVAAYLFAGEGTYEGADEADPFELGARLSLSF